MSCSEWSDYANALQEAAFRDAVLCPLQTRFGGPELALLMFGAISIGYTLRQGSIVMSYVIAVLFGGAILTQVAPLGVTIITIVVLMLLGAGPVLYLRRKLST